MNNETHETHEDRVKILEGAPDDTATHIDADGDYIKYGNYDVWCYIRHLKKWICYGSISTSTRSLSDIQQLVDKKNEIDALKGSIKSILTTYRDSSGYEPSLSVFHRELSEAEELLDE